VKFARRIAGIHHRQTIGIFIRKRLEQDGSDDTEDGRVGTDAQSKRQDDQGAEGRPVLPLASGLPDIEPQMVKPQPVPPLVAGFFEGGDVAEGAPGSSIGIGASAAIAQIVGLMRQMRGYLLLEILRRSALLPKHVTPLILPARGCAPWQRQSCASRSFCLSVDDGL
jgi:hypothetical protein